MTDTLEGADVTRLLQPPEWDDPQAQVLQDTWLLTLFAVLLATAVPWFVSAFNIDFAYASWALAVLGMIYVGLALVAGVKPDRARLRARSLTALHLAGVVGIGFLWWTCGGLQNPAFLIAFALPVIGASSLSRWQPYATALLAILVAGAVALLQAPELRWYVAGLHAPGGWLSSLLGTNGLVAGAEGPFPAFYAPVGYDVVVLEVFGVLVIACAVASETLGNSFERVLEHLRSARTEAARGQEMWATLVGKLPMPAFLVDVETQQIVLTSRELEPFCPPHVVVVGQGLFESIHFSYPERVQELLAGRGGTAAAIIVHTGDQLHMANLQIQHVVYDGRLLALMLLQDTTAMCGLEAALDAQEQAVLVIDGQARVLLANRGARSLFPAATPGSDATQLLAVAPGARWWDPGVVGRRRLQLTHQRRRYQVTCTAVGLPGEQESFYVAAFSPLALALAPGTADSPVSVVR